MTGQEYECINIEVVWLVLYEKKHDIIKIKCTGRKSRYEKYLQRNERRTEAGDRKT